MKNCLEISKNIHGTRAMQTLVEFLSKNIKDLKNEVLTLIDILKQDILDLSTNVHSNHVI